MISKADKTDTFISNIDTLTTAIQTEGPDWLKDFRRQNLNRFFDQGFPSIKDEEWKYTNVAPILKQRYVLREKVQTIDVNSLGSYYDDTETNLVFINGQFSPQLSSTKNLPKGIVISNLRNTLTSDSSKIEKFLKVFRQPSENAFLSINQAVPSDGAYIEVADNIVFEKLIHIIHITTSDNEALLTVPKTFIYLGRSSEITVLESHISVNDTIYLSSALTDIYIQENATIHYTKAQAESKNAYHIGGTRAWQEQNSNFDGFSLMTGASLTRNNLDIILAGEGSTAVLNGLYCVTDKQHVDNHTSVDHQVPNCVSNQLYKGILTDSTHAVFNGKIFVRDIAQKTNSYQLNKNLLLGNDCRVDTKPQLEIFADDVKCTHGATIGQLNEDEIFYLRTRGIQKSQAIKMLSRGFVDDILNNIKNDSINRKLHQLIEPIFANL
jgi:Fe-S cluster assembly protein SufD